YAEAALDTVGPQDMTSRASTRSTLARVRSAQGRFDEAEKLLREAVGIIDGTEYCAFGSETLQALAQLLADRGREDEAEIFERRLEGTRVASSAARIARCEASPGDSLITVAGRSKGASASPSGSARSVPSPYGRCFVSFRFA